MSRCTNRAAVSGIGVNKIDETVLSLTLLKQIENCMRITTKNTYNVILGDNPDYDMYDRPKDMFNCDPDGCTNTGTLYIDSAEQETPAINGVIVKYLAKYDATEWYAGTVTYYVYFDNPGEYSVTTYITDIKNASMDYDKAPSDAYITNGAGNGKINITEPGYYPILVDLTQLPSSVIAGGWEASTEGAVLTFVVNSETVTDYNVGLSSIYLHDSIEDFQTNDTILVKCLTDITDDLTVDPIDTTCMPGRYDKSTIAYDFSFTAKLFSPNYWKLNPLASNGEKTMGFYIMRDTRPVLPITINGIEYGYVQAPDMYMDECAFTSVSIKDECNITDAYLDRIQSPVTVILTQKQFQILDGTTTNPLDAGKILVNPKLVGKTLIISYPRETEIEHFVENDEYLNDRKVKIAFDYVMTDNTMYTVVLNNVLITSFPRGITESDESEFQISVSIQRDKNGNFREWMRKLDE